MRLSMSKFITSSHRPSREAPDPHGKFGVAAASSRHSRHISTQSTHDAYEARFERETAPDGTLPLQERPTYVVTRPSPHFQRPSYLVCSVRRKVSEVVL